MECGLHGRVSWATKESNTGDTRKTSWKKEENAGLKTGHYKPGSAEEVFGGGADDAGRGLRGGLEAVAADQDDRGAFGFTHQEAGGGGELVGDGENGGGERLAVAIASAAQIMEDGDAGRPNGNIC